MVASAAAFAFYARVELPWMGLGLVGLVPWLLVLDRATSTRATIVAGLAYCVAFSLAVFGWFADAIAGYASVPHTLAWALLAIGAPALQPQLVAFAIVRRPLRRALGPLVGSIAAALIYVATEWAWPKVFADTLGHGLHASALLRQGADVAGAPGLTLVVLAVNESLAVAWTEARRDQWRAARALAVAVAIVLALAGYGRGRLAELSRDESSAARAPLTVALVQASITGYEALRQERGTFGAVEWIVGEHVALTDGAVAASDVDLVVWPETVYPTTFGRPRSEEGRAFDKEITRVVERSGLPLVFGSYDVEDDAEFNAAFLVQLDAAGRSRTSTYRKTHLFPLTEYVPAWLDSPALRRAMPWLGTWRPGPGPRVLDVRLRDGRSVRFSPLICLDDVVASHALDAAEAGAEVLVTMSNDSWFAETPGARLHLVVSAFRSVETRLPQVRVTNSGISAVIGRDGELLATTRVGERTALVGRVVPGTGAATPMLRWGDWFGPVALIGGLGAIAIAGAMRGRRGGT